VELQTRLQCGRYTFASKKLRHSGGSFEPLVLRHRVSVETARLYLVELAAARTRLAEAQRQSK
jgi:hypothetical protein